MHKHLSIFFAFIACISVAHQCLGMDKQIVVYQHQEHKTGITTTSNGLYLLPEMVHYILKNVNPIDLTNTQWVNKQWYYISNSAPQIQEAFSHNPPRDNKAFNGMFGVKRYHHVNKCGGQAVKDGDVIGIQLLLKHEYADPNYHILIDGTEVNPAMVATAYLNLPILKLLQGAGTKINRGSCYLIEQSIRHSSFDQETAQKKGDDISEYLAETLDCKKDQNHYDSVHQTSDMRMIRQIPG